jgi:Uma2 family endonuclease
MGVPTIETGPMTIADYLAFTDTRPDEERWELIEGSPVSNASPVTRHQVILKNLAYQFGRRQRESRVSWRAFPGTGVRVSATSLPQPDFLVRPRGEQSGDPRICDDPLALFEILSPSTASRDLRWKRDAYTSLPTLLHYVVIAQDAAEVVVFSRDAGFAEQRLRGLSEAVPLTAIGVTLPLSEIYEDIRFT